MIGSLCKECYQEFTDVVNKGTISNRGKCTSCHMKWLTKRDAGYMKKFKEKAKKPLKA
jgi:hydrogenase maturation factor HypF (carbamoyltransferase family)